MRDWKVNPSAPRAFVVVSGIHAGTYLGGFVGTVLAAVVIVRMRKLVGQAPV